jgi:hypothetical protein
VARSLDAGKSATEGLLSAASVSETSGQTTMRRQRTRAEPQETRGQQEEIGEQQDVIRAQRRELRAQLTSKGRADSDDLLNLLAREVATRGDSVANVRLPRGQSTASIDKLWAHGLWRST